MNAVASPATASERAAEPPLLVLVGPTAGGKSGAALHAAPVLDAEIVVCDSVKAYRGLEIASAAPTTAVREQVPHHLVSCVDPAEHLNAARWLALAEEAIEVVRGRGRVPLVVAGTPLYLRALLYGLLDGPPRDAALRERLTLEEGASPGSLHGRLRDVDNDAAERIHPNDLKRLLRALEVHAATGRPISAQQTQWSAPRRPYRAVGLRRSRDDLRSRIVRRIDRMFAAGLHEQVAALLASGDAGPTAREAIGVKELAGVPLDAPEPALARAREELRAHTWQLARHQRTWWRRFPGIHWLDVSADEPAAELGERVAARLSLRGPGVARDTASTD